VLPLAAGSEQLRAFVGRDMLRGAFAAVAGASAAARADLLHLARDILVARLPLPPEPREVSACPALLSRATKQCVYFCMQKPRAHASCSAVMCGDHPLLHGAACDLQS
jgi:hypothetical protein